PRLRFVVRDEVVVITADDPAIFKQVVYSVADLIVPVMDDPAPSWARSLCPEVCPKERGAAHTCEEALLHYITRTVAPESWHDKGGPGTLQYFPLGMVLVVNQTPELQQEVAALLLKLRRLQRELDKSHTLQLTWVEGRDVEQTRMQFPKA